MDLREVVTSKPLDHVEDLEIPEWYEGPPLVVMKGEGKVTERRKEMFQQLGWGRMWASGTSPNLYPDEPWGFDNGAFHAWRKGHEGFPEATFLERLERAREVAKEVDTPPTVAVVPDLMTEGLRSLEFSVGWIVSGELPSSWPWYLALQGGMTVEGVQEVIHLFDGLFIGGGHEFKFGTRRWLNLAREYEIPFHYGGCGTVSKFQHAVELGVDSIDSASMFMDRRTFVRFMATYFEVCKREMENSG